MILHGVFQINFFSFNLKPVIEKKSQRFPPDNKDVMATRHCRRTINLLGEIPQHPLLVQINLNYSSLTSLSKLTFEIRIPHYVPNILK